MTAEVTAGLTLLNPFLPEDCCPGAPVIVLEELEAATVEAVTELAAEAAAGGGAPVGVVTSEATEGPETTRFIGLGLIRAAMGLSWRGKQYFVKKWQNLVLKKISSNNYEK